MKIVAVDPGGTTGFAEFDTDTKAMTRFQYGPQEHHLEMYQYLNVVQPDVLICERFNYQRRELDKGVSLVLVSREYIGICKLYAREDEMELVLQQPSCMQLFDDRKLRALGLYLTSHVHANDATRHLLYYMTTVLNDDTWIRRAREPE